MENRQSNLDVKRLLALLRRRLPLILFCLMLAGGSAFAFSRHQARRYSATATVVFKSNQEAEQVAGLPTVATGNQPAQQQTNLKLLQHGDMAERTASKLDHGLTGGRVSEDVSVSAEGESNLVDVSATASSPALAAAIANTYVDQFVSEQQNSDHAYYASALGLVDRQLAAMTTRQRVSPAGLALQGRADSLGVLAELRNGTVQVAQAASPPTGPSSPKTTRNTILGAVLGLLLGVGLAFLLERFDRRIREPKDLEAIYGLPLLGVVPESKALAGAGRRKDHGPATLPPVEAEAFQLIRAHLRYFNVDRRVRTIMVASAAAADGKTTVACHLAVAAAQVGSRVLLMEVDLRRPTLVQQLGIPLGPGLTDVLIGSARFDEAVRRVPLDLGSSPDQATARAFDVLVCGLALPPNAAELIESHAMASLLERVEELYDLVVIDTPPLTAVSDAFPLLRKVDGVIIVGRVGRDERDVAQRLHETLKGVDAPLLGVIANGVKTRGLGSYGYAYDYAPDRSRQSPASNASPNGRAAEGESLQRSS